MDFGALAEQHLALAGIHRNIAGIYLSGADVSEMQNEDAGEAQDNDRPGCDHPKDARMPTTYLGNPAFICKKCGAVVGTVDREE